MKYLKNFNELIKEEIEIDNINFRDYLMNIFKIFKTKDELEEIFDDEDELIVATDLYDAFIDTKDLIELDQDDLQSFADNLGVGGETDILIAIVEKMYEEKFKRKIKDDIIFCIDTLNDFIMTKESTERLKIQSKRYLDELEKIKNNL